MIQNTMSLQLSQICVNQYKLNSTSTSEGGVQPNAIEVLYNHDSSEHGDSALP